MARETGLPSNQEFPASVSGVTGGFVSKAAGVGREGRRRQGLRGCALTPYPLYPRAYFFVGGREGPMESVAVPAASGELSLALENPGERV